MHTHTHTHTYTHTHMHTPTHAHSQHGITFCSSHRQVQVNLHIRLTNHACLMIRLFFFLRSGKSLMHDQIWFSSVKTWDTVPSFVTSMVVPVVPEVTVLIHFEHCISFSWYFRMWSLPRPWLVEMVVLTWWIMRMCARGERNECDTCGKEFLNTLQ